MTFLIITHCEVVICAAKHTPCPILGEVLGVVAKDEGDAELGADRFAHEER